MSKGSKKTTSKSTSSVSAPAYLSADTQNALGDATSIYNAGAPAYYPGQTYANFDPLQTESMDDTVNLARQGSPLVKAAQGSLSDILSTPSGQNPTLQAYLASLQGSAANGINQSFNANGRFGSGSNAAAAGTAITNASFPVLQQAIQADNQNKLAAAGLAPTLANYDFTDAARIGAVGDLSQAQTQKGIDENVNRYDYNAAEPENWLNGYLQQLNQSDANNWTTQKNQTTQTQSNGSGLGTVLGTGLGLASLFTGTGPFAALGGSLASAAGGGVGAVLNQFGGISNGGFTNLTTNPVNMGAYSNATRGL